MPFVKELREIWQS